MVMVGYGQGVLWPWYINEYDLWESIQCIRFLGDLWEVEKAKNGQNESVAGPAPLPFSVWCISRGLMPRRFVVGLSQRVYLWSSPKSFWSDLMSLLKTVLSQATSTARSLRSIIDPIGDFRHKKRDTFYTGWFFSPWYPPKKYGKPRLGESTLT